jgi:hypothetical protein
MSYRKPLLISRRTRRTLEVIACLGSAVLFSYLVLLLRL